MPVLDASVVVEYLAGSPNATMAERWLFDEERSSWVPHLLDAEVGHALRRAVAAGLLTPGAGRAAITDLADLPLIRAAHTGFIERAWELRANVSFYDAIYVALAERIGTELVTSDRRLARAADGLVEVVVLG